jgi:hypothetical protein
MTRVVKASDLREGDEILITHDVVTCVRRDTWTCVYVWLETSGGQYGYVAAEGTYHVERMA